MKYLDVSIDRDNDPNVPDVWLKYEVSAKSIQSVGTAERKRDACWATWMRVYDKQLERVTHAKFKIHLAGEACCGLRRYARRGAFSRVHRCTFMQRMQRDKLSSIGCQPGYRRDIWMRMRRWFDFAPPSPSNEKIVSYTVSRCFNVYATLTKDPSNLSFFSFFF